MQKKEKLYYIITLAGTLFAMTLIVYYTFGSFYKVAKEDAVRLGKTAVNERAKTLDNFLSSGIETINITAETIDYMLKNGYDTKKIEEFIVETSENYADRIKENYTGMYAWIHDTFIDSDGWIPTEGYIPTERSWYMESIKGNGQVVLVTPYVDALTKKVVLSLSRMLSDGKSVISLDLISDGVQVLAEEINLNGNGYGFIMDSQGIVVAHTDEEERGKNYFTDESIWGINEKEWFQEIKEQETASKDIRINGEKCTVFSERVEKGWYVVMVINSTDLFRKVQSTLWKNIVISSLVFVLVGYFCTSSHFNKIRSMRFAEELKCYQLTLEERVLEQTEEIRRRAEEMIEMQEDVIEGMATLIESRDGNTGEHVRNTKKYVQMIASKMQENKLHTHIVSESYVNKLVSAAPLHDVGKIKISDLILNKPAKLNEKEYEIMKNHSFYGGEIIQSILGDHTDKELLEIAEDIAKYHHERWDGEGYPEGLKGNDIPLAARIMAVADVFDALVSKRVYKDKIPMETAFGIIEEEAGKQFDPEVVKVFLEQKEEIISFLDL